MPPGAPSSAGTFVVELRRTAQAMCIPPMGCLSPRSGWMRAVALAMLCSFLYSKAISPGVSFSPMQAPWPLVTPILVMSVGKSPTAARSLRNRVRNGLVVATGPWYLEFSTHAHSSCWAAGLRRSSACLGSPGSSSV
ncbi:hypothetical protein [Streptomyces yunnanensis]|uniref:hypothetical protein n=1 Tax=Streptomyces yunnanensis TaxID=156453 RepID=UPI003D9C6440